MIMIISFLVQYQVLRQYVYRRPLQYDTLRLLILFPPNQTSSRIRNLHSLILYCIIIPRLSSIVS